MFILPYTLANGTVTYMNELLSSWILNTSPNPVVFPWCNAAMGGAKLIIARHVACHVTKHGPDSRKENILSPLTGLGKGYCCILLSWIRPEGKVLSSQIAFCAHTTRISMCCWRDVIAGSSAPISLIQNLFSHNQDEIASTGEQIVMVGRQEVLSQSLPSLRYRLSVVCQKSLNVSEQNCNVYWSKVWIQLTPKLMCTIYSTAIPLRRFYRSQ